MGGGAVLAVPAADSALSLGVGRLAGAVHADGRRRGAGLCRKTTTQHCGLSLRLQERGETDKTIACL